MRIAGSCRPMDFFGVIYIERTAAKAPTNTFPAHVLFQGRETDFRAPFAVMVNFHTGFSACREGSTFRLKLSLKLIWSNLAQVP